MAVAGSGMAVTEIVPCATVDQPVGKRTYNQDNKQFGFKAGTIGACAECATNKPIQKFYDWRSPEILPERLWSERLFYRSLAI